MDFFSPPPPEDTSPRAVPHDVGGCAWRKFAWRIQAVVFLFASCTITRPYLTPIAIALEMRMYEPFTNRRRGGRRARGELKRAAPRPVDGPRQGSLFRCDSMLPGDRAEESRPADLGARRAVLFGAHSLSRLTTFFRPLAIRALAALFSPHFFCFCLCLRPNAFFHTLPEPCPPCRTTSFPLRPSSSSRAHAKVVLITGALLARIGRMTALHLRARSTT